MNLVTCIVLLTMVPAFKAFIPISGRPRIQPMALNAAKYEEQLISRRIVLNLVFATVTATSAAVVTPQRVRASEPTVPSPEWPVASKPLPSSTTSSATMVADLSKQPEVPKPWPEAPHPLPTSSSVVVTTINSTEQDPLDIFAKKLNEQAAIVNMSSKSTSTRDGGAGWPNGAPHPLPLAQESQSFVVDTPARSDLERALEKAAQKKQIDPRTHG